MGSGGKGPGGIEMADAAPSHHLSRGACYRHALLQGGKGLEQLFSLWGGESLRRLPTWEKGLRSLLLGREIPEEGISLGRAWACKGSAWI